MPCRPVMLDCTPLRRWRPRHHKYYCVLSGLAVDCDTRGAGNALPLGILMCERANGRMHFGRRAANGVSDDKRMRFGCRLQVFRASRAGRATVCPVYCSGHSFIRCIYTPLLTPLLRCWPECIELLTVMGFIGLQVFSSIDTCTGCIAHFHKVNFRC